MKRRNFFLTLFGSLFLGKAVARTNVPKIISGTLEVERGGGKQYFFMDKDNEFDKQWVETDCTQPDINTPVTSKQLSSLEYLNKTYPKADWFFPEGHSRTGTHIEYRTKSRINSTSAQSQAHLNHSDKR